VKKLIQLSNITHFFGEQTLYKELNWIIPFGTKTGFVGNNGSGKTTLFKILMGSIEPHEGNVFFPKDCRIGYLPQDLVEIEDIPLLEYLQKQAGVYKTEKELKALEKAITQAVESGQEYYQLLKHHDFILHRYEQQGGYEFSAMAQKVMKGLGFSNEDIHRKSSEFSGGWKMRISLAALLLSAPDILLLDEPTNHLDTESMEWLEEWLLSFNGTLVAISHDRRFLDKVCSVTAELSNKTITVYKGNFSWYLEEKARKEEELERTFKKQKEEIEKTKIFIERFRYKATKAAQVQSRIRQLEKMDFVELDSEERAIAIHFPPCPRSGHNVLSVERAGKQYDAHWVFSDISFNVTRGEKIALVGVNGAGKSTLSRLISKAEPPTEGKVLYGYNVKMGFFSQESAQNLDYKRTVWEEISHTGYLGSDGEKRNLLGAFLFCGDDIYKSISVLSGGEKSRVALLKLLLKETNLLILDEPTNHLDMRTRDIFQQALMEYSGTLIIVSHDRYFLDNLVSRVIEIRDGQIYDYPGNYSYFIEKRKALSQAEKVALMNEEAKASNTNKENERKRRRKEGEIRNIIYREKQKVNKVLEPLEQSIAELESEKAEIEKQLCSSDFLINSEAVQEVMVRHNFIETQLEEKMKEWEVLMEKLEAIEEENTSSV
jgi:ATP-binding cassette subfamily F protein 3